jgi:hypothetical protein
MRDFLVVMPQKAIGSLLLEKPLVGDEILAVLLPAFGEILKATTGESAALVAVGDPPGLTAEVKGLAAFATLEVFLCPRTGLFIPNVDRAAPAEDTAGGHPTGIEFHVAHGPYIP